MVFEPGEEDEGERDVATPDVEIIEIAYGHPSGAVQAHHVKTGQKQIADSPEAAVGELWAMLEEAGTVNLPDGEET